MTLVSTQVLCESHIPEIRGYNTVSLFDIFLSLTSTLVVGVENPLAVILTSNALASFLSVHIKEVVSALD